MVLMLFVIWIKTKHLTAVTMSSGAIRRTFPTVLSSCILSGMSWVNGLKSQLSKNRALSEYFDQIRNYPRLDAEQEKLLARQAHAGDREAYDKLVQSNLRLVVSIAKKYHTEGASIQDFVQDGNIGLMRAARRFDPERGIKFSTYATYFIRNALDKSVHGKYSIIRVPYKAAIRAEQGKKTLMAKAARKARAVFFCANFDDYRTDDSRFDLIDNVDTKRYVIGILSRLSVYERLIIRFRFGLARRDGKAHTFARLAKRLKMSKENVRLIQQRGVELLGHVINCENL